MPSNCWISRARRISHRSHHQFALALGSRRRQSAAARRVSRHPCLRELGDRCRPQGISPDYAAVGDGIGRRREATRGAGIHARGNRADRPGAELGPTDTISHPVQSTLPDAGCSASGIACRHRRRPLVFDPQTRVLLAGDLVTLPAPFFESACPARWRAALAHLDKAPFDWLVPGHGAPMRKAQFTPTARRSRICSSACRQRGQNACVDGWIGDASALFASSRDASYARSLIGYYMDNYLSHPTSASASSAPTRTIVESREGGNALLP